VQVVIASEDDNDSAVKLAVTSWETNKSWVMVGRCSYPMCSRKKYYETLELKEGGVFHLRNNKECKVQGISSIHLKFESFLMSF